jgi:hypothetical protein
MVEGADCSRGPFVIVGRPHSGSRLLAKFCLDHGAFLGRDLADEFLDSEGWYQRFVVPLILSSYFPDFSDAALKPALWRLCLELFRETWPRYWDGRASNQTWGWKYCETLFVMPLVKRLFPSARFLHIIRDPRDVCLCDDGYFQLTRSNVAPPQWSPAPVNGQDSSYRTFCSAITFGQPGVQNWNGISLDDPLAVSQNRFLLQAQCWLTCVTQARLLGKRFGRDYCEVHYEDFCLAPESAGPRVLEFTRLPASRSLAWFRSCVRTDRIAKWRKTRLTLQETRDFSNARDLLGPVLPEFGYASS